MNDLANEYHGESQFNKKRILDYLDTFLGVKLLEAETIELGKSGELDIAYTVTPYGKKRERTLKHY